MSAKVLLMCYTNNEVRLQSISTRSSHGVYQKKARQVYSMYIDKNYV